MRFSYRLLLIACVSACAPMLPEPPLPAPSPSPQTGGTVPETQPAPTPTAPPLAAYDQQGFEGWRQGFLARKGGARRAAYERELANLTPDPTVIRLDRNQPEFSKPAGAYVQTR